MSSLQDHTHAGCAAQFVVINPVDIMSCKICLHLSNVAMDMTQLILTSDCTPKGINMYVVAYSKAYIIGMCVINLTVMKWDILLVLGLKDPGPGSIPGVCE